MRVLRKYNPKVLKELKVYLNYLKFCIKNIFFPK